MNAPFRRRHRLLALFAALIAFGLYLTPAPQARAQSGPEWYAWNMKVDFVNNAPRVIATMYQGVDGTTTPAAVTGSSSVDISSDCRSFGGLSVAGGKAIFAANAYIKCRLPANLLLNDHCTSKMSPFHWAAARVKIDPNSLSNPIIELTNANNSTRTRFSLPINAGRGQSQLIVPGASYLSDAWDLGPVDNRVLIGAGGPSIVSVSGFFAASNWLGFLTGPQWQNAMNSLPTNKIGSWSEPQMAGWQGNRILENWPDARFVYIGHSPSTGTYFTGTMWDAEIDPGCTAT